MKFLVVTGALLILPFGYLRWRHSRLAVARAAFVLTALTGTMVLLLPDAGTLWARLHGTSRRQITFAEDGAGLSVLKHEGAGGTGATGVYINGLGQSWIPYGGIHTALGALPVLIHPAPADVLIIGLGSGDSAFAAAGRSEVRRLTCVEIIGAQLRTLRQLARTQRDPGLVALLSDPRIEHKVGDGRAFIRQSRQRFDVIEADALRPTSAYAGILYSQEYFTLLSKHLKPGGLAVTWAPTERIQRTFLSVFPHVLAFADIYVGSNTVIPIDRATVYARAAAAHPYYQRAGIDITALVREHLEPTVRYFGPNERRDLADLNTDIFPRDEFALPY